MKKGSSRIFRRARLACGTLIAFATIAPGVANATWATGIQAPLPANADGDPAVRVQSVSCASPGNCTAVGSYRDNTHAAFQGLLLTETAGVWAPAVEATLPNNSASSASVSLTSVSCASAGNCTAVGGYRDNADNNEGLMLTETGGVWSTGIEATLPADAGQFPDGFVNSVSCRSAGNCTAVGTYETSSSSEGLLLTETGGVWSTGVEASLPADAATDASVLLPSVSCGSVGNCTAVGSYENSSNNVAALLLTETGGVWGTGVAVSLPPNAATTGAFAGLSSVSCASADDCGAVGAYDDNSDTVQGLLLTKVSGVWGTGLEATLPANHSAGIQSLVSVSCPAAGNCSAGGNYIDSSNHLQGLLLNEISGVWATGTEATLPANAATSPNAAIESVSCGSPGNCSAVGAYLDNSFNSQGLLLNESSGVWAPGIEATPPANAATNPLVVPTSVSCPSANNCTAVGTYFGAGTQGLLLGDVTPSDFSDLIADSRGVGPGKSLVEKARTAQNQTQAGDVAGACTTLSYYITEVQAQTGKSINRSQAPDLLEDARLIGAQLGCTGTVFSTRRAGIHRSDRHRHRHVRARRHT
jgi:hypothetical protein